MKRIVKGNDFIMRIPVVKMVEGEKVAFPLPACTDIVVRMCNAYRRTDLSYTIDASEDNVLLAKVEGDQIALGTYALEVKGKIFGADWRSNEYEQIQIVDNNAKGDTAFTPDENEDSVEMDTAVVVLPPSDIVTQLVKDTETAVKTANEARDASNETNAAITAAELLRVDAEEARQDNETARQAAENSRANTEALRVEHENARITAENARATAEEKRETDTKQAITDAIARAKVSVSYNAQQGSIDIITNE